MSPRSKESLEEIKKLKRELILNTALRLFAEHTFRGTTIDEIAREAGISKGLIYNYFNSKDELLAAIFEIHADSVHPFFQSGNLTNPVDALIEEVFDSTISQIESDTEMWSYYYVLSFQFMLDNSIKHRYAGEKEHTIEALKSLLISLKVPDAEFEVYTFMALFQGAILNFIYRHDFPIRQVIMKQVSIYQSYYRKSHENVA